MKISVRDIDDHSGPDKSVQATLNSFAAMYIQYDKDVRAVMDQAIHPDPNVEWGLLLVGCSLANLTLIPSDQVTDKRNWLKFYGRRLDDGEVVNYYFLRYDDYMKFL